ncbi:acyl carrier protein [Streptomyces rubiginosohelvolus]|uniref:acyl carrier protein n=1 Tax=Streptomyces rubiginosohelvolus TaxID=67362 RepID=UPI003684B109
MAATTVNLARQVLTLLIEKYEAPADTTETTSFELLGFDSLVLVEVSVDLKKKYSVEIGDDELAEADNAAKTAELLTTKGVTV